ncbi:hypothetical protein [Halomonas rhizosphaerae]|uniref:Uncharacterized protein n=1 Tax=Halomonas rhizosphaerae TaxID=3043296 RepID=A0ABT6UUB5_9GAMM|nr:hypothetical protein [Halomonas rhizosphaerae]MDI5889491.1 hypothetical protein [Halomonas rhizosphaerae]
MYRLDSLYLSTALAPEELMGLAIDHEREEMHRYRYLAFVFLTFGRGISRLMAVLGIECERRLGELNRVACEVGLSPTCVELPCGTPPASGDSLHLINDRSHALATLRKAEARAEHAVRVAEHLHKVNATPAVQSLLAGVVGQKQSERHILQELIESYDMEFATDAQLASCPWPRGWLAGAKQLHFSASG